ncbi:hypothetical protein [Kribbella sindirgiensis]|uniref:Type IV toxin-antitoxin system AbiEi family antitoxin domain-containing protein n=1 Tax=Kribbella sindirgiensis TaxID=1124744 RepID=A0A4R0IBK4_9ACTN|nr:hypothetical protein [Kribbella sindirgiensis]TCC29254.1 hypothetical protein E0H50_26905 [Kribbella sindirgiensis]
MDRLGDGVRERLVALARTPQRRAALRQLGIGDADLRRLVRRGALRHHHGHYVDGRLDEQLATIACAHAAYPSSVVSHFSAARLAGLPVWTDSGRPSGAPIDAAWLTRPPEAPRNQRRPDIVVRRAGLTAADLAGHGWLPVTRVARTVVDLARELPLRESIVTVDGALRAGTTPAELHAVAERQQHWPGVRRAQEAIAFGDPSAESVMESIARAVFAAAGLPTPLLQVQFFDGFGWMPERVDFWWPWFRTVGEADGLAKYEANSPAERRLLLRRSHRRDQRLSDRGVELVHFGWEDVVDPRSDLIARLRAAFARGESRTTEPPRWRAVPPPRADAA